MFHSWSPVATMRQHIPAFTSTTIPPREFYRVLSDLSFPSDPSSAEFGPPPDAEFGATSAFRWSSSSSSSVTVSESVEFSNWAWSTTFSRTYLLVEACSSSSSKKNQSSTGGSRSSTPRRTRGLTVGIGSSLRSPRARRVRLPNLPREAAPSASLSLPDVVLSLPSILMLLDLLTAPLPRSSEGVDSRTFSSETALGLTESRSSSSLSELSLESLSLSSSSSSSSEKVSEGAERDSSSSYQLGSSSSSSSPPVKSLKNY